MKERATRIALVFLAVAALAVAIDNFDRPLANPDEGRYSEISREMVASGDWITPRLDGIKYFEKPPLQYWATALVFRAFGQSEITARVYTGFCGLAAILLIGFTARRLGTGEHALAAMMALASSPYFMALGGVVTLDMGLTLWTSLTFCALLLGENAASDARERRRWLLVAWAAMALAVLSKGLVGIVFPAAALGLHALVRGNLGGLLRLEWIYGPLVFLAIAAPWFVAVSYANPEFPEFFFIHEHFQRFLTTSHRRVEPWWYFPVMLFAGFLPWMFALPGAIASAWERERGTTGFRPLMFALWWTLFIVAFFSASGSKLPGYILPAFPALALVLGRYLAEAPTRRLAAAVLPVSLLAVALAFFAWRAPLNAREAWTRELYQVAQPYGYLAAASLFMTAAAGTLLFARARRSLAIVVVALGTVFTIDCIEDAYEEFSPRQSGRIVAEKMGPWLTPAARVYSVRYYEQTIPFYIGRTVTLVDYLDEFEPGLRTEPGRAVARLADFPAEWLRPGDALAIMQPDLFESLRAQALPMQVLHQDPRRVLVRKP
jgi:4-amino-4-deoxy-L-arabinose transferase-like glycosyltransferase